MRLQVMLFHSFSLTTPSLPNFANLRSHLSYWSQSPRYMGSTMSSIIKSVMLEAASRLELRKWLAFMVLMLALTFAAAPSVQHRRVQPCVVVLGNLICMPQSLAYLLLWQLHRVNRDGLFGVFWVSRLFVRWKFGYTFWKLVIPI